MELAILKDIVIIFALSTLVNLVFTRIRIPTVVGYLITGIIAGPHLLTLVEARHNIELMAEIGVVLLLFTIGLEFSLKHLLKIRRIVFFGGFLQVALTAGERQAVVAGDDDKRIVEFAIIFEHFQQLADFSIESLDFPAW